MAQEYGRYFGLNIGIFRGGCLTGPNHSGVKLHGFLSYLAKCIVTGKSYKVFGHKGKQVRDQIHNSDVMQALDLFITSPKKGAVYNLGGGVINSASVLESIQLLQDVSGKTLDYQIMDEARIGDHICYYSDMTKFQNDFPTFRLNYTLEDIALDLIRHEINAQ